MHHVHLKFYHGMRYAGDGELILHGFVDFDWVGNAGVKESTSSCCFILGSRVISWFNREKASVAMSSAKAKYMAVSTSSCETLQLHKLIAELTSEILEPIMVCYGNHSCIRLSKNLVFHHYSKNIDIRYHFLQAGLKRKWWL